MGLFSNKRATKMEDFKGVTDEEQPGMRILASITGAVLSELVKLVVKPEPVDETET